MILGFDISEHELWWFLYGVIATLIVLFVVRHFR